MKQTKYLYTKVIQQVYGPGYGWADVGEYECTSQGLPLPGCCIEADLKEYKLLGYPTRVVMRKTNL